MVNFIKKILPRWLKNMITSFFYGWSGNYKTWEEARAKCSGYDSHVILEKVKRSVLQVKEGIAAYERDSVIFDKIHYSYPLLASLMWIATQKGRRLNVLDFGGSLGSTYFQNKTFFDPLEEVNWCIVEQPDFVKTGNECFTDQRLHFFYSIEECFKLYQIDLVLLSSVLQYLEKPYSLLNQIISTGVDYIIVDRTPFIQNRDRITIQKVNPKIYNGSYPCWFFSEAEFLEKMKGHYCKLLEFEALDKANIPSEYKGYLFRRNLIP